MLAAVNPIVFNRNGNGGICIAPSANLNPERDFPSLFEPIHGSAPDIYGLNGWQWGQF